MPDINESSGTVFPPGLQRPQSSKLGDDRCTKKQCILNLVDRFNQMQRNGHIPDAPTCESVSFGEGEERNREVTRARHAPGRKMPSILISKVFIGFVMNMINPTFPTETTHFTQYRLGINRARRIVRGNRYDRFCPWRNGLRDQCRLKLIGTVRGNQHRPA